MGNPRDIIIAIGVSVALILGFGLWVGYQNGDLSFGSAERIEDHEFPRSLSQTTTFSTVTEDNNTMHEVSNEANPTVTLKTTEGDIVIELYEDVMPITAGNFISLAEDDFYDGTKFHRVIEGFMIQGGDPNSKTDNTATYGTGGPGYAIEDEHIADPRLSNVRGTISMANSGPNSGGSQFFINLVDNTGLDFDKQPLSSKHPVFGAVIAGMDVVAAIGAVPTNERDLPLEPVVVTDVVVGR